jgi:hypothetical protein
MMYLTFMYLHIVGSAMLHDFIKISKTIRKTVLQVKKGKVVPMLN